MNEKEKISEFYIWLEKIENIELSSWENLPDIDLYMDQIIGYMDKQLNVLKANDDEKTLTPAMVNNYVKCNTLPKPAGKKYNRGHMARLFPLYILKQTLPLPVIGEAINDFKRLLSGEKAYDRYRTVQNEAFRRVAERVFSARNQEDKEGSLGELEILAFEIAVEAAASRLMSERMMNTIIECKRIEEKARRDQSKKKETSAINDNEFSKEGKEKMV